MKKKTIIIVIGHNNLAQSIVETAEMIVGKKEGVFYINFLKQENISSLEKKICKLISQHQNCNFLIFLDLFGGSCYNACCRFVKCKNIKILSGVNLPILLEAILSKDYVSFNELVLKLKEKTKEAIFFIDDRMKRVRK